MLSKEEFVKQAFAIAAEMAKEPAWAYHVKGVDAKYIRFKSDKNVDADCLERMREDLLKADLSDTSANVIVQAATKGQTCVNRPMLEIARRIRAGLA